MKMNDEGARAGVYPRIERIESAGLWDGDDQFYLSNERGDVIAVVSAKLLHIKGFRRYPPPGESRAEAMLIGRMLYDASHDRWLLENAEGHLVCFVPGRIAASNGLHHPMRPAEAGHADRCGCIASRLLEAALR